MPRLCVYQTHTYTCIHIHLLPSFLTLRSFSAVPPSSVCLQSAARSVPYIHTYTRTYTCIHIDIHVHTYPSVAFISYLEVILSGASEQCLQIAAHSTHNLQNRFIVHTASQKKKLEMRRCFANKFLGLSQSREMGICACMYTRRAYVYDMMIRHVCIQEGHMYIIRAYVCLPLDVQGLLDRLAKTGLIHSQALPIKTCM